jgi:hypothetical protein
MRMESTGVVATMVIFATLMASCAAQGNHCYDEWPGFIDPEGMQGEMGWQGLH